MDDDAARAVASMWEQGDYSRVAERLTPAAERIAELAGAGGGQRALDVAAGTGSLALALAGADWAVTATDIAPRLVAEGASRARAAGRAVDWQVAPLDAQPAGDATFDLVASSFGLIFAPEPAVALDEVLRVLRPGGTLVFSAWTPSSYMAHMTHAMASCLPANPAMDAPFRWGAPERTAPWLEPGFTDVSTSAHTLPWSFPSSTAATEFVFEHSPAHVATLGFAGDNAPRLRAAVREHLERLAEPNGAIEIAAEYVVTTARRR